jgi:lipopolysaccharide export system ATP-binding protein
MSELKAEQLKKRYKSRVVVKDVSLEVRSGEVIGLLGPNGAGKTTCFYMMVGLHCSRREIYLDEKRLTCLSTARAAGTLICRRKPPFSGA